MIFVGSLARNVDATDLSDLTASVRTGPATWGEDGTLMIPFDLEPSAAEQLLIRRRLVTRDADEEAGVAAMVTTRAALRTVTQTTLTRAVVALLDSVLRPYGE